MKTKFSKIFLLLAVSVLLVGCITIAASAEGEATLALDSANVAYNDMMQLAFTLKGDAPADAGVGIAMWNGKQDSYTAANASYTNFVGDVDNGVLYYKTPGIAATDIGTSYYFAACYKLDGETVICGEIYEYSIAKYVASRLDDGDATQNQAELYDNILLYGLAAGGVLEKSSYSVIKCVTAEATVTYVYFGEALNITADGCTGWKNAADESVSESAELTVDGIELGQIITYTAIYN